MIACRPPAETGRRRDHPARRRSRPTTFAWLQRWCASVELLGQDVERGVAIELSNVYVPALVPDADATGSKKGRQRRRAEPEERQPVTLLERIDRVSLYVPAPAGAGKSTFCRWAVLQSIEGAAAAHPVPAPEEFAEPVAASLRTRLPLLVPLRDFALTMACGRGLRDWKRGDLEGALAAWIDGSPPDGVDGALVRDHIAAGSAFLLLDGLDEVSVSDRRDGATVFPRALLLSGLADALPAWEKAGNRTLLTSRPYGLDEAGLARLGLARAPLEPLPGPLQELFVARWLD
jgi:hypothetical protein